MAEKSRAERLVEVATTDKRVIAAEIAVLGLSCLYLKKRMGGDMASDPGGDSAQVLNQHLESDDNESDGFGVDAFVHTYTSNGEGTPFKLGIGFQHEGTYKMVGISGVQKMVGKAKDVFEGLSISQLSVEDPSLLELLRARMVDLKDNLESRISTIPEAQDDPLQR